jgi:hypothetical protein
MRRHTTLLSRLAPLALGLLGAPGCTGSPEDLFFIRGRFTDAAGQPLVGARVDARMDFGQPCSNGLRTPVRSPLEPARAGTAEPLPTVATGEDGRFLYELYRFQFSQGDWMGGQPCARLTVTGEGGVETEVGAGAYPEDLSLAAAPLWTAPHALTPVSEGGRVQVASPDLAWADLDRVWLRPDERPEGVLVGGGMDPYDFRFAEWQVLSEGGAPVWRVGVDPGVGLALEPEVLEDFAAPRVALEVLGYTWPGEPKGGPYNPFGDRPRETLLRMRSRTAALPAAGGPLVPVSRGAPCSYAGKALSPCPFTDGALALVALQTEYAPGGAGGDPGQPPAGGAPPDDELRVELPRPTKVRRLVFRDVVYPGNPALPLPVEGSVDGVTWQSLLPARDPAVPVLDQDFVYQVVSGGRIYRLLEADPAAPPVRWVRLAVPRSGLLALRELSVFE